MRLLNTRSRTLHSFDGPEIPPYVILSHTWGVGEITFQDVLGFQTPFHLQGYQKFSRCCEQAVIDGYDWVWTDTCCINKTSSAELSEAINSMFRWYEQADMCYAYLSDVHNGADATVPDSEFAKSRWFTRGWTLQELIAPSSVIFYNSRWQEIGTKNSLHRTLSTITGIDARLLRGRLLGGDCDFYSVACRMSWASKRVTTRPEDGAYCLMGILGVNMPLLYGEGERSFLRLQEEIMKRSDDHSLFAWTSPAPHLFGLLAPSPREFLYSGQVERLLDESLNLPYSNTNQGLQITLNLVRSSSVRLAKTKQEAEQVYAFECRATGDGTRSIPEAITVVSKVALLQCQISDTPGQPLAVVLVKIASKPYSRAFAHFHLISPLDYLHSGKAEVETIFINNYFSPARKSTYAMSICSCTVRTIPSPTHGYFLLEKYPSHVWSSNEPTLRLGMEFGALSSGEGYPPVLLFGDGNGQWFAVVWQQTRSIVSAGIIGCLQGERARDVSQRAKKELEPHDCEAYRLSKEKWVLLKIRKCPGGHIADITIHTEQARTKPMLTYFPQGNV